jgi:hypothetical protein
MHICWTSKPHARLSSSGPTLPMGGEHKGTWPPISRAPDPVPYRPRQRGTLAAVKPPGPLGSYGGGGVSCSWRMGSPTPRWVNWLAGNSASCASGQGAFWCNAWQGSLMPLVEAPRALFPPHWCPPALCGLRDPCWNGSMARVMPAHVSRKA